MAYRVWRAAQRVPAVAVTAAAASTGMWWGVHAATGAAPGRDTTVYAWGGSQFGETGLGHELLTGVATATPLKTLKGVPVVAVASSGSAVSSAAWTSEGEVYTWGCGKDGRLGGGDGGTANELVPRMVHALVGKGEVVAVSLGEYHGAALTRAGRLFGWGKRAPGHEGVGVAPVLLGSGAASAVGVACGREHSLAVTAGGELWGWGVNTTFALGTGSKTSQPLPVRIEGPFTGSVVAVAAGREHSLLLTREGQVYAAGTDGYGQCGQGSAAPFLKAWARVDGPLAGRKVVSIAAGEYHSMAVCDDGVVYVWGFNRDGTLGLDDRSDVSLPRPLPLSERCAGAGDRVVQVACGGGHSLFLTASGKVYSVGRGRSGQLGRGGGMESVAAYRTDPVEVLGLPTGTRIISIAAGRDHSLAVGVTA